MKTFLFRWEERAIRSIEIEAETKEDAYQKWLSGDYLTPDYDDQDILGKTICIDDDEYYITNTLEVAE